METASFEDELNHFMRAHRILSVQKEFAVDGSRSCWCICIEYMDSSAGESQEHASWQSKERADYRELLNADEFARFARMRSARKALADNDHIPAYAIMKDDQLAELSKLPIVDEKALKALAGFGEKKYDKYGQRFWRCLPKTGKKMKRAGNLYHRISERGNLELAFWRAQRGKADREEVMRFRENLDGELETLACDIDAGNVAVGDYHYFTINAPKARTICAASFRERVLHYAIMSVSDAEFEP